MEVYEVLKKNQYGQYLKDVWMENIKKIYTKNDTKGEIKK